MIECRGRNGWFKYDNSGVFELSNRKVAITIQSKKIGKSSPIYISGERDEIKELLKGWLSQIEGD